LKINALPGVGPYAKNQNCTLMTKFNSLKVSVLGDTDQISSERYFVTVSALVASVFLLSLCIVHVMMSLKLMPVILAGSSSLVMLGLYYFVRFRNCLFIPKVILTVLGLIMLDITWYSKFLSNGPVLFFILIFAALVVWVWEGKWLIILLTFYFLNLALLFYINFNTPEFLSQYPSYHARINDIFLSFFLYSILLISILFVVKQEFVRQAEKAKRSDRLKSAFLANMSHEIRTPMNGILGFARLLRQPELSIDKHNEYIKIIEKSGVRMLNIINDIIDISKIEAGLMKMDRKETNVNEQIEYTYNFFKPEVEAKGMTLNYKISLSDKSAIIDTDREKLYAVLTNLVKNAIKYSEKGNIEFGYVLKTKVHSSSQKPAHGKDNVNKELEFYVKDEGIGIPVDELNTIFERFIQVDIDGLMARQGAGLGLAISKTFVEMLGGKIRVESEKGKGSTFYFTLPYTNKTEEHFRNEVEDAKQEIEIQNARLKILIADDDETSEMLLSIMLNNLGRVILKARTGIETVELVRHNPDIDLILMDIQMPEINGYEATRQIRQFNDNVTIIAQTAFGLSGDNKKAIEAGCNDYISKPIDCRQLNRLIQKYFNPMLS